MGNCCTRNGYDSNTVWAGDDWGSTETSKYDSDEKPKKKTEFHQPEEKQSNEKQRSSVLFVDETEENAMKNSSTTEVKITITKKQLEELLGNVEVKELSVQELLHQLMNVTNSTTVIHDSKHRSWRPVLQSIPETMEAVI